MKHKFKRLAKNVLKPFRLMTTASVTESGVLMPPHDLANFEIHKQYQNERIFNGVYSRNSLHKINYGAYVTGFGKYESIAIHETDFYVVGDIETYFDSFGVEYILKKFKNL